MGATWIMAVLAICCK